MYYSYRKQCPPGTFLYTIKAGDNFYSLAMIFKTTVSAIIAANPRVNPNNIQIGQIICVPRQETYPACPEGNYYIIRAGDTLYGIANRYNVSLDDLFEANPGISPYMLMIGQVICIPLATPPVVCPQNTMLYIIKAGDTFHNLAKKFNTTNLAIIKSNPSINPKALLVGQKVCIPKVIDDLPQTKEIPVFVEGKKEYRQAKLQRSEQGYYIYTLANYQFTAEEPGNDVIFSTIDDNFFVRIQRRALDANISELKQNAILSLKDIGEARELSGEEISDPFFRTNKFFLNASNNEISVNRILKEIDGSLFNFTMFLPSTQATEEIMFSFYAMMKTIRN